MTSGSSISIFESHWSYPHGKAKFGACCPPGETRVLRCVIPGTLFWRPLIRDFLKFVHKSDNGVELTGGRNIQLISEAVLFTKLDFVKFMLFLTFGHEFCVRGDGLGAMCKV